MNILQGIGASPGIAMGKVHLIHYSGSLKATSAENNRNDEALRFQTAREKSLEMMSEYYQQAQQRYSVEMAKIYKAYLLMLQDDVYIENINANISAGQSAELALITETERLAACLLKSRSEYLVQRAEELRAIEKMVLGCLQQPAPPRQSEDNPLKIILADELTPADTIVHDPAQLKGFVTCRGGVTSHAVILAKELGIPAIVGAGMDVNLLQDGQPIIIDGDEGMVWLDPDEERIAWYHQRVAAGKARDKEIRRFLASEIASPLPLAVGANITSLSEACKALEYGADGIGLVRTEFLYMNRDNFPDEQEQLAFYQALAAMMPEKEIVIRTLDIGGDKQAGYIGIPPEENPFLGHRAIRYCLDNRTVFATQLTAILRASAGGNLKILIPMITTLEELLATKALLEQQKNALRQQQIAFDENIPLGIMIETPAAAMMADVLACHCDFFSIGSNDLTQYITASDRNNSHTRHLYCAWHPAVLRAIKHIVCSARQQAIAVHICGEIASDQKILPFLIAIGVDELSVTSAAIPAVKYSVAKMANSDYQHWLAELFSLVELQQINQHLAAMSEKIICTE